MTPFPGTPLYERLRREGRLLEDGAWERCSLFDVNFEPARMTAAELQVGLLGLARRLYTRGRAERPPGSVLGAASPVAAATPRGRLQHEHVDRSNRFPPAWRWFFLVAAHLRHRARRWPSWWAASRSSTAIGMELPPHIAYIQLAAVFIVVQGLSYLFPWHDAWSNEGVVWVGVAYKASTRPGRLVPGDGHAAEHVLHPLGHHRPRLHGRLPVVPPGGRAAAGGVIHEALGRAVPVELTGDGRIRGRILRLAAVSLVALGLVTGLAGGDARGPAGGRRRASRSAGS